MTSLYEQVKLTRNINLDQYNVGSVGSINHRCILTLPSASENKKQKFIIGDQQGNVTLYTIGKKNTIETLWTLNISKKPINSICLGGLKTLKDQIYASSGNIITGMKKVGKEFFRFPTTINDDIETLVVDSLHLNCFSNKNTHYTHFEQSNEIDSRVFGSSLKDLILYTLPNTVPPSKAVLSVLIGGFDDGYVRILNTDPSKSSASPYMASLKVEGPVTAVTEGPHSTIFYGTSNGYIGQMLVSVVNGTSTLALVLSSKLITQSTRTNSNSGQSTQTQHQGVGVSSLSNVTWLSMDELDTQTRTAIGYSRGMSQPTVKDTDKERFGNVSVFGSADTSSEVGVVSTSVTSLAFFDMLNHDDTPCLAVGTTDGIIQVMMCVSKSGVCEHYSGALLNIIPVSQYKLNHGVTSLNSGYYYSTVYKELLIHTYNGNIVILSPETRRGIEALLMTSDLVEMNDAVHKELVESGSTSQIAVARSQQEAQMIKALMEKLVNPSGSKKSLTAAELKDLGEKSVALLTKEVNSLKKQVADRRDLFSRNNEAGMVALKQLVKTQQTLTLLPQTCLFRLAYESELSLDVVCFVASCPLTMIPDAQCPFVVSLSKHAASGQVGTKLDGITLSESLPEKESDFDHALVPMSDEVKLKAMMAIEENVNKLFKPQVDILTASQSDLSEDERLLATFRCGTGIHKIECKFHAPEGISGQIKLFCVFKVEPKRSQLATFAIKPLCLHVLCTQNDVNQTLNRRKPNSISVSGDFSIQDFHHWLSLYLNDLPAISTNTSDSDSDNSSTLYTVHFKSSLLQSVLSITVVNKKVDITSDNMYTCWLLKHLITTEAISNKVKMNIAVTKNNNTVLDMLQKHKPYLHQHFVVQQQVELLTTLEELQSHETELESFLESDLLYILENKESILAQSKETTVPLAIIISSVVGLFEAIYKIDGKIAPREKLSELNSLLTVDKFSPSELEELFKQAIRQ